MASDPNYDAISLNVEGVRKLVESNTNKVPAGSGAAGEGVTGEKKDFLTLEVPDEVLLKIAQDRSIAYSPYEAKIKTRQDTNFKYYKGSQNANTVFDTHEGPITGNLIFEAVETFLPAALAKNPEPVVWGPNNELGNKLADDVKIMLQYHATTLNLRQVFTIETRRWMLDFLGCHKYGWDKEINDITIQPRDTRNFLFEPTGYVDIYGHFHGWLGERITLPAAKVVERFPQFAEYFQLITEGKMGTNITYTEWWDDDMYFITCGTKVLDKGQNYFYNYEEEDVNHFPKPMKPYTFLSVYSFMTQPHDVTGLIEQNIPNQNNYTKSINQISSNIEISNTSIAVSADNYTQQTAKQAARARQIGHPILVPPGRPVQEAVVTLEAAGIPAAFFDNVQLTANNIRSIFGINGIVPQQRAADETARGMILEEQFDSSRIGGSIGDAIERVAATTFNWLYQLYHVFYDEEHEASIIGSNKAIEYAVLSKARFGPKLVINVSPDSMKPKNEIAEANQATALWEQGAIDPKTLLKMLNFPDPQETAEMAVLWKTDPAMYLKLNFPELVEKIHQASMPAQVAPGQQQPGSEPPQVPVEQPPQPKTMAEKPPNPSLDQVPLPK